MSGYMLGWQFLNSQGRFAETWSDREGLLAIPGRTTHARHKYNDSPGHYASHRAIDAVRFGYGSVVARVVLHGDLQPRVPGVMMGYSCRVIWVANVSLALRDYSHWCNQQVLLRISRDVKLRQIVESTLNDAELLGYDNPYFYKLRDRAEAEIATCDIASKDDQNAARRVLRSLTVHESSAVQWGNVSWYLGEDVCEQRLQASLERYAPRVPDWDSWKLRVRLWMEERRSTFGDFIAGALSPRRRWRTR